MVECRILMHAGYLCFGDARVYARAITVFGTGGDPYAANGGSLLFVYPPWFLYAASSAGSVLSSHGGWFLYLGIASLGLLSIPILLATSYVAGEWLTPFIAMVMFTFEPRLASELILLTGNIANLLYALILLTGVSGVRRNRWGFFYIAVAFATLIKPPFIAFLILPLLAGKKQLWLSALCGTSVLVAYWLQSIAMHSTFLHFQQAVYQQVVVNQDRGYGLYNYIYKAGRILRFLRTPDAVLAAHLAVIGTLLLGFYLFRQYKSRPSVERLWIPALVVLAVLTNPRLQGYDWVVAIIPATYICIECLLAPGSPRKISSTAILITAFAAIFANPELGVCLVLVTAVLLVLFRLFDEHFSGGLSRRLLLEPVPNADIKFQS